MKKESHTKLLFVQQTGLAPLESPLPTPSTVRGERFRPIRTSMSPKTMSKKPRRKLALGLLAYDITAVLRHIKLYQA